MAFARCAFTRLRRAAAGHLPLAGSLAEEHDGQSGRPTPLSRPAVGHLGHPVCVATRTRFEHWVWLADEGFSSETPQSVKRDSFDGTPDRSHVTSW